MIKIKYFTGRDRRRMIDTLRITSNALDTEIDIDTGAIAGLAAGIMFLVMLAVALYMGI